MRVSKKLSIAIGSALLGVTAFGVLFTTILSSEFNKDEKLKLAARWLVNGRWDLAGRLANDLESSVDADSDSSWHYVKGVSQLLRIIDDLDSYQNRIVLSEVTQHLEKCQQLGFPLGYRGKGNYYLGICLFNTYRWSQAIEALNLSLTDYPEARSQSLRMIFTAHLRKPRPDIDTAEAVLQQWLQMPGLSERELAQTRIAHAQLAIQQNLHQDCKRWLAEIQPGLPEFFEGLQLQAICLMHLGMEYPSTSHLRTEQLNQAQNLLQALIVAADTPNQIRRQSLYLSGRVLRYQGQLQKAVGVLSGVRQQSPFSAEAIAASLEEAEILMELNRWNEVTGTTRLLLYGISDMRLYNEYWLPTNELRSRLIEIGNRLREEGKYELALELAEQLPLAFPISHALRLQASILTTWGFAMEREIAPNDWKARSVMADMFARAGEKFEQLAGLELRSREFLNIVWNAAENYQKAGRLDAANRMLDEYLRYESRSKQPRALLALGRNHITVGGWEESLEPLKHCLMEYPTSPNSYEARLLAARALTELNDFHQAIELLSSNLWDFELHPESPIWKDSFIELGNLLFQRGKLSFSELPPLTDLSWNEVEPMLHSIHEELIRAVDHLSEAARRYPNDPRNHYTRYQLACGYQLAAQIPKKLAEADQSLGDADKKQLTEQRNELLEKSAAEFGLLQESITARRDSVHSDSLDPAILRSAFFGKPDVLAELGLYEEAVESYRGAASYYTNQPEALEAFAQIAECCRKLGREAEAQKAIRQAELLLERIPTDRDASFVSTTRGDRRHWQQTLGRLKEWN